MSTETDEIFGLGTRSKIDTYPVLFMSTEGSPELVAREIGRMCGDLHPDTFEQLICQIADTVREKKDIPPFPMTEA